jgi:hypothetical protein
MVRKLLLLGVCTLLKANLAFALVHSAKCGSININTNDAPYSLLPLVAGLSIYTDVETRDAALTQIAGSYRLLHGGLTAGTIFGADYVGGTSECVLITDTTSSFGAVPVSGTQVDPSAAAGPAPGDTYGGGGGAGGGGQDYYFVCYDSFGNGQYLGTDCYKE